MRLGVTKTALRPLGGDPEELGTILLPLSMVGVHGSKL